MYIGKTDAMTFDTRKVPTAVVSVIGFTEADHAMAYVKDLFKRLTGYPAEIHHDRGPEGGRTAGAEADRAMAYAEETLARMKGYRPDHPHDRHHLLEYGGAGRGRTAGGEVERAMDYAKDVFKRLKGLRVRGPLGPYFGRTAKTEGASVNRSFPIAKAIGGAMARLARLIRRSVVEPYVRGRRRRIAIAQLETLDDRLLTDIGLERGDIEPTVDGMLARRRVAVSPPDTRFRPAEEQHDPPLAA